MKKRTTLWLMSGLATLLTGVGSGCQNTADGAAKDTKIAAEATAQAAQKVSQKAAETIEKTDAKGTAKHLGKNVTAALEVTPRVKAALLADKELSGAGNHLDVDSKDGIVHLKGHVVSNALKKRAGEIAKKTVRDSGGTDEVRNHLLVK